MPQLSHLSPEQFTAVMDHAPMAVLVSFAGGHELLYANRLVRDTFLKGLEPGPLCCYHAAGYDKPCPFCHAHQMTGDKLTVREYRHPRNGRVYQLSGQIIDWGGRPAHIEYIEDITDRKLEEERAKAHQDELREILGGVPGGLCVYRYDSGNITPIFHNSDFYTITGYSPQHIRSVEQATTFLGVHPDDLAPLQEKIDRALADNGSFSHTYRLWNDSRREYRWIRLEARIEPQPDGSRLMYGVYSDVSGYKKLEQELISANEKMQGIVNAIPGGVAIYKMADIFKTVYFSDGVPELSGYTPEEYRDLVKCDASDLTYHEDTAMVVAKVREAVAEHTTADLEFRKQHRDGHIVWVHMQARQIGEEDGCPLIQCVFHNITQLKEAQSEMEHLINSIPGGIASYRIEGGTLVPLFFSDGVAALSGHSREELGRLAGNDVSNLIYEPDRARVMAATLEAIESGAVLDVSYRIRHSSGSLVWVHVYGRRMGPLTENAQFYAVFSGLSEETRLFQSLTNDMADGIYVIEKDSYELLYVNESEDLFTEGRNCLGQKCYQALHGKDAPCDFCTLHSQQSGEIEHEMAVDDSGRFFATHFREINWNGVPAYVKYVRDATEEIRVRAERDRLEQYFQTVIQNLPGGIAVIRLERDGRLIPEYLSEGFAALCGMTLPEAWALYRQDARSGVHPDDWERSARQLSAFIADGKEHFFMEYRLRKGAEDFVWVRVNFSLIQNQDGVARVYAVYHDITEELEEKERLRRQYNDLLIQHYQKPGPNALIVGHCNINQNRIMEIIDYTDSGLLDAFGPAQEDFFTGLSGFVVDEDKRRAFLDTYLNGPALAAFRRGDTERLLDCFIRLPKESKGRYVQFKMDLVAAPDSGDVTGILTVTDTTEQVIADRVLHHLSITGYDFLADLDLLQDRYQILSCDPSANCVPPMQGCHSKWVEQMLASRIVPRDREAYRRGLEGESMLRRLEAEGAYTFSFSVEDDQGDIRTKSMTVSPIDLRLKRVCLSRTDITEPVREQQGLLNMIAYTFDLAGFVNIQSGRFLMHTSQTVRENLPPYVVEDFRKSIKGLADAYGNVGNRAEIERQFCLDTMLSRLEEAPEGYDFVLPHKGENGLRYKQINVLWGDRNHQTICLVRLDVTDMLAAERESKRALEEALSAEEEANRAKSDFLSAMSHDIRTPLNAIMGMTALAIAHSDDQGRVMDCLRKISTSSKHLLSLVNDILDMNRLERSKLTLERMRVSLPELLEQLNSMMSPQAKASGLLLSVGSQDIVHPYFYADSLRVNQILINILGNAVKFTPEGGRVDFLTEEIPAEKSGCARYRFTIRDTGIGMSKEFLAHLFEPFTRSHSAAKVEGSGLGLSIAKGLVDLLGGTIRVESVEGTGTTFTIELEAELAGGEPQPAAPAADRPVRDAVLAGRRILVAEDNAINAEITCGLLELFGASSVVRTDGSQAVLEFRTSAPGTYDAILMDIQMPVMNGYEAARAIRETDRADARTIPIIAMTANAFAEDIQASQDAGMTSHVSKPIDVELLRTALTQALAPPEQ